MRILFITGEYPSMQGGVGDYTRRLGQALGLLGADVHVLTNASAGGDHLRVPAAPYEPTVHAIMTRLDWRLWGYAEKMIRELRPEVVHIQYQSAAYGLHAAVNLLPWRLRAVGRSPKIVTTFHDLRVPYLFPKAGRLRWQAVLTLARGSDASVITNPTDWQRVHRTGLRPRLHPIPIGSNIHCEPSAGYDRNRQRARWGAGPDDWLLAYFGFLNASKGGETLIRALAELVRAGKPARLLMVGGKVGSSDATNLAYLARVEALIEELGIANRVMWTGFVPSQEVSDNLLAADCAVLPYREGASLRHGSLMAALAHGLAICSTDVPLAVREAAGHFPMLCNRETALLVPPNDPAALAQAVTDLMGNPAMRKGLADAALALSRQFEWETIAQRHLEMYRGLGVA